MYPDLNDEPQNNDVAVPKSNYQATSNSSQPPKKEAWGKKKQENCCVLGAKIWVSIMGFLGLLLGIVVIAGSLYAKFGYNDYAQLASTLPDGGIWMILGFGCGLSFCAIILMLSARFYENKCFQTILVIVSIVLALLLIMEIVSGAVLAWGLGVITLPESEVTDAVVDRVLQVRNATLHATYEECCVNNVPPYNIVNISKIDTACLWPQTSSAVKESCGVTTDGGAQTCVCASEATYGRYVGIWLRSQLMWVSVVTIVLAVLLLGGLICTCVLINANKKKSSVSYTPGENQ